MPGERCSFEYGGPGQGPQCCVIVDVNDGGKHEGSPAAHRYKCAGPSCPGYPSPASVASHPISCAVRPSGKLSPQLRSAKVRRALELLRQAAAELREADAPKTLRRVRAAISSCYGADRAAEGRMYRAIRAAPRDSRG